MRGKEKQDTGVLAFRPLAPSLSFCLPLSQVSIFFQNNTGGNRRLEEFCSLAYLNNLTTAGTFS